MRKQSYVRSKNLLVQTCQSSFIKTKYKYKIVRSKHKQVLTTIQYIKAIMFLGFSE